ncbi:MAG: FAD-dependent oxidoreductase, partial [Clostridia bacterium]
MTSGYDHLSFDVIVVGGGPAGTVAAIAASRNGAKVLLVEKNGFLGGMLTGAGTGPMMTFHAGKTQVVRGIPEEIVQGLVSKHYSVGHMEDYVGFASSITPFDPEGMKIVLEEMCMESGVSLLYHTVFVEAIKEADAVTAVRLFSKNGFFKASAKVFIDASADADLALCVGVSTQLGRESDGLTQPMSANMLVGGVNRERVIDFVQGNRDDMCSTMLFDKLHELPRTGIQGGRKLLLNARQSGQTNVQNPFLLCFETNTLGQFIINMTRVVGENPVDAFGLTRAEVEGRRQAQGLMTFYRKFVPGFENAFLISTGPNIGV